MSDVVTGRALEILVDLEHWPEAIATMKRDVAELKKGVILLRQQTTEMQRTVMPYKEWYTRAEAAELKGVSKSTLDKKPWLYPNFGKAREVTRGRFLFHRSDVMAWLPKSEEQIRCELEELRRKKVV